MKIRTPEEVLESIGISLAKGKSDLDIKIKKWLENLAEENGQTIDEFVKELAKDEIENRKNTLPKLKEILEKFPTDLQKLREASKENNNLSDHWLRLRMKAIWENSKSQEIFERFVNEFPESDEDAASRIDEFVTKIVELLTDSPNEERFSPPDAKILTSVILSSLYPDRFVDYKKKRWIKLTNDIGISAFTDKNQNEIIEAGNIAKLISETDTFKKYWKYEHPLQTVASLCWTLKDKGVSEVDFEKIAKLILEDKFELAIDINTVKRILRHLNAGKHVILVGAPGVGKTALAKRILKIYGRKVTGNEYLPSVASAEWTRRDVIGGINLEGKFRPGFVTTASKEGKWLLIDEFNRADINKAFGEMFFAIEDMNIPLREEEKIEEYSSGIITIPDNFRMICTMNDFDKNLLLTELSYGLITRFAFVDIKPDIKKEQNSVKDQVLTDVASISDKDYEKCKIQISAYFDFINEVRQLRMIGVRTSIDITKYVVTASKESSDDDKLWNYLDEAICDYLLPQFDRLDRKVINHVLNSAQAKFNQHTKDFVDGISNMNEQLERISNFLGSENE